MTTAVWYRSAGAWVGVGGVDSGTSTPPVGQAQFAGHTPNRILLGFANSDLATSQLDYTEAVGYTGTIYERRKFTNSWVTKSYIDTWLDTCGAASQFAWLSFKVPNNDWAGVSAGQYDAGLDIILERAAARSESWMVSVHHEPDGDGTLSVWATMQEYISNYLAPMSSKVAFAPIGNGFWFGPNQWAPTKFDAAFPQSLIDTLNTNNHVLAVDSYDSADPAKLSYTLYDRTSLKVQGFLDWARSKGSHAVGFGEFGCHTGEDLRRCWNLFADNCDIVGVANYFNSGANSRANWLLVPSTFNAPDPTFDGTAESQARLDYYKDALAVSVDANPAQVPA